MLKTRILFNSNVIYNIKDKNVLLFNEILRYNNNVNNEKYQH